MSEALRTYLNDHLAGSVAAVELLDHLLTILADDDRRAVLVTVRKDVEEDQEVLRQILHGVGAHESIIRKAAAWLTEKIGPCKAAPGRSLCRGAAPSRGARGCCTRRAGQTGALAVTRLPSRPSGPNYRQQDFALLQRRAEDQHQKLEALRLRSARVALAPSR